MLTSDDYLSFLNQHPESDSAHDTEHVRRVVRTARYLCEKEQADWTILEPAAWLHDCVQVPKNSPERKRASVLAAERAAGFLAPVFDDEKIAAIRHCIEAHSFSAGIKPETLEAEILQDADRLDAVGAIGVARCLITGAGFDAALYHPDEPEPHDRPPEEKKFIIDHFYTKLLKLAESMNTESAKEEAYRRTETMKSWLAELYREIRGGFS